MSLSIKRNSQMSRNKYILLLNQDVGSVPCWTIVFHIIPEDKVSSIDLLSNNILKDYNLTEIYSSTIGTCQYRGPCYAWEQRQFYICIPTVLMWSSFSQNSNLVLISLMTTTMPLQMKPWIILNILTFFNILNYILI